MRISLVLTCLALWSSTAGAVDVPWRDPVAHFKAVNAAIDADDFEQAQELLADIRQAARTLKDQEMLAEVTERIKEASDLAKEFSKVSPQVETLKTDSTNTQAALAVGRYECIFKANWGAGLA